MSKFIQPCLLVPLASIYCKKYANDQGIKLRHKIWLLKLEHFALLVIEGAL